MGFDEAVLRGIADRLKLSDEEYQQKIGILERMGFVAEKMCSKGGDMGYSCIIQNQ